MCQLKMKAIRYQFPIHSSCWGQALSPHVLPTAALLYLLDSLLHTKPRLIFLKKKKKRKNPPKAAVLNTIGMDLVGTCESNELTEASKITHPEASKITHPSKTLERFSTFYNLLKLQVSM